MFLEVIWSKIKTEHRYLYFNKKNAGVFILMFKNGVHINLILVFFCGTDINEYVVNFIVSDIVLSRSVKVTWIFGLNA